VLAQKADRSRGYGRIGSVSQQQTSFPRILEVLARYPRIKKTETLFNEKEGVVRSVRPEPKVRLRISCLPHQPFYLYGTFHDGKSSYLSFFKRVVDSDLDFTFSMPPGAQDPKVHASMTPPPPHLSHEYISEAKSNWIRSRSQFAGNDDFFNLGFTPVDPELWDAGSEMSNIEQTDIQWWSGRKSDFDPRIHGAGPNNMGKHRVDMYGGSAGILPIGHGIYNVSPYRNEGPIYWFVFAEFVEGKGWKVIPRNRPTFKAGASYCMMGAMYFPSKGSAGREFHPEEGADAPQIHFVHDAFVDYFGPKKKQSESVIDKWGWKIQPYTKGVNGGWWTTDAYGQPEFPEAVGVSVKNLYDDNGAGLFFDTLGKDGERLQQTMRESLIPPSNQKVIDFFSVDLEYYDFGTGSWGDRPKRKCDSKGRFAWYFRPKRQLDATHPDVTYDNSRWSLEKTQWAYPTIRKRDGTFHLEKTFIGFKRGLSNGMIEDSEPFYRLAISWKSWSPAYYDSSTHLVPQYTAQFADPDNFAYSTNQQILRAFYEGGEFKPGNKVLLIGRGLDRTNFILCSQRKSLLALAQESGLFTPAQLLNMQFEEQFSGAQGEINTSPVGWLKPVATTTADAYAAGKAPEAISKLMRDLLGETAPENMFGLFVKDKKTIFDLLPFGGDEDEEEKPQIQAASQTDLDSLPEDAQARLVEKLKARMSPLDGTAKDGSVVKQMRDKPTHYQIGEYEFPFTIGVFEIPSGYGGPAPVIDAIYNGMTLTMQQAQQLINEASLASGISTITVGDEQVMPSELVSGLTFRHNPQTPDKVYMRFKNALGEETTGYMEDLSAELQLQVEKQNHGLTSLQQFVTDPVSVDDPEDVGDFDDAEQSEGDRDKADAEYTPDKPLLSFSFPKLPFPRISFAKFNTDNLIRKHTLIPYGSRKEVKNDPKE